MLALNTEDKEDEISKMGIKFWFIYWYFTWLKTICRPRRKQNRSRIIYIFI